jgi:polyphosphate kinase
LKKAGVQLHFTDTVIKVHSKLLQISIGRGKEKKRICYLSTGNFNEKTAKLYADSALFTTDIGINNDAKEIFDSIREERETLPLKKLLLAPNQMRTKLYDLIDREIENKKLGKPSYMIAKMNGLQDEGMIEKIYEASSQGVKVDLLIRSICCVKPGVKFFGENIRAVSIVDRFLEHTRVYIFCNNGKPLVYLSSADWMSRNLKRRIEVAFPVENLRLKREVLKMIELQLNDNTNARILDEEQTNKYKKAGAKKVNAQSDFYAYLKRKSLKKI